MTTPPQVIAPTYRVPLMSAYVAVRSTRYSPGWVSVMGRLVEVWIGEKWPYGFARPLSVWVIARAGSELG